ncbi:hypothetical protein RISK_003653 [Rhodopirellula islandica]|uniref:Uncharacterized protein n=1 Tax=Rhodopirellula islandica TaxID=595434 RepID=A0A0J1BBP7_RHOIS|nr:hypothetical protein [Rhodopirellula islandica]KLU04067.1 hypothetical protein RISK_003653 [Rhodopirellula islandica]
MADTNSEDCVAPSGLEPPASRGCNDRLEAYPTDSSRVLLQINEV